MTHTCHPPSFDDDMEHCVCSDEVGIAGEVRDLYWYHLTSLVSPILSPFQRPLAPGNSFSPAPLTPEPPLTHPSIHPLPFSPSPSPPHLLPLPFSPSPSPPPLLPLPFPPSLSPSPSPLPFPHPLTHLIPIPPPPHPPNYLFINSWDCM
ncbi:hypothetical protein JAAARDRAFT_664296 [Jaapia argillacea MUCL 33604]|uniref:Uncharacterized protein n=1 Tax=Jaapia argillacea MUCL 33604 TaxID=933084 RepID=A0A067PWT0_9AGAM|nr:hypothetical protein JAAARDRAFT_664296 [Jaapia argillacea MUCL 33604]